MKTFNKIISKAIPFIGGKIEITFNKEDATPVSLMIYDDIGKDPWTGEGFAAKDLASALSEVSNKKRELKIHINSRGGDVNEGKAIRSMLEDWEGKIVNIIDGVAASTASWMIPADETHARSHSQIFIHKSWAVVVGNADDMTKATEMLNITDGQIADIYAKKTGKPRDEMLALMAAETLLTGDAAKDLGLVDKVIDGKAVHNFSTAEISNMKQKLAALNSSKFTAATGNEDPSKPKTPITPQAANLSAPSQGAEEPKTQNPQNIMNKTEMLALLNKWGIQPPADATDEAIKTLVQNGPPTVTANTQPAPAANTVTANSELAAIKAQLKAEKDARITDKFNAIAATRPTVATNREAFLAKCLVDDSMLAVYSEFPETAAPLNSPRGRVQVGAENIIERANKIENVADRYKFRVANYAELNQAYLNPRNANTTDSALVTDMLLDGATTVLQNRLAPLRAFSKEVSIDRIKPKAVLQHRQITAGGTAQSNATSFEDTTNFVGTEANIPITIAQLTSGGHITNAERQNGVTMDQWVQIKTAEISDKIMAAVAAVILEGTYTATPVTSAAAAFGAEELKTLWGQLKKSPIKNVILDGEYYARFIPSTLENFNVFTVGIPGWDTVALNTVWTGATTNTVGFACNPQAIVCGIGLPLRSDKANLVSSESVLSLPDLGISVAVYNWYSNITRTEWATYDIMFGAAANDATAGVLIKSS